MGLLVGLPLKIFFMLFTVLRFVWPLILGWLVYVIVKKLKGRTAQASDPKGPDFDGPVVEVDYEVVDEKEE